MIGTVLENRYELECLVGTGGMAEVYRAFDREENRTVAIKMLKREYCEDGQYMRRFERETQAMLTLDCPNIVRAFSYGTYEGRGYIVLEYIEGLTLKEYLKTKGKLSPRAAVHIACRVLNALDAAHKGGYVHRDVKPQNVLISTDKTIKLTDFGIAKDTASITRTFDGNNVVGSVHYISPEQASGGTVGVESDIYSVGIMLYEMLVGEPPFDGDNSVQIALKHINEPLTPPMEKDPDISPALSDVIVKATAKDLSVRYSSAEALKNDLIRALREPESRFAYVENAGRLSKDTGKKGGSRVKLWHFILPASLMVALVLGMFTFWYFYMFGNSGKSTLSKVPDVLDRTVEEATELLKNREFDIRVAGTLSDSEYEEGRICKQSPASGTALEKNSTVDVWLSSGTATVSMKSLIGMTLDEAAAELFALGISVDSISYTASDEAEGTIVWQSIPEGTELIPGEETISVEISGYQGVTLIPMPNLMKITSVSGINRILSIYGVMSWRYRFGTEKKGDSTAAAYQQNPSAGLPVLPSATAVEVTLFALEKDIAVSDVSFEMVVDSDGTPIEVVLICDDGEFILYETVLDKQDAASVKFRASFYREGEYVLAVLAGGSEVMRFNAVFTGQ